MNSPNQMQPSHTVRSFCMLLYRTNIKSQNEICRKTKTKKQMCEWRQTLSNSHQVTFFAVWNVQIGDRHFDSVNKVKFNWFFFNLFISVRACARVYAKQQDCVQCTCCLFFFLLARTLWILIPSISNETVDCHSNFDKSAKVFYQQ